MKFGFYLAVFAAMTSIGWTQGATDISGRWLTENGKGVIAIAPCGDSICGKIDWLQPRANEPAGQIPRDKNNHDPAMRQHPICGLEIIYGFRRDGDPQHWIEGNIYDPESGDTYHANITLQDANHLRLRGYVGIPLFGESQIWTRANTATYPACRA